jgi:hypothetical protein
MRASFLKAACVTTACLCFGEIAGALADDMPSFAIVAKAGRLSPERVEVPAGKRVKLTLRNESSGPVEFENLDLRVEKVLAPGASSFVVLPALKPGSYRFVDEFHPDTGATLIIAK